MLKMIEKSWKIIIFMYFYAFSPYVCGRKIKSCRYFICGKLEKLRKKACQKWKIKQFSESSKIVNSAPNHVLNSGKNSYRMFEPESKD